MNEHQNAAASREDIYRLLAACYYSPTPPFLDERCCEALAGLLAVQAPEAAAQAAEAARRSSGQGVEALAVEHARLFLGPFHLVAPPYGSYYLDEKTVMGDSTAEVETFYHSCGLHFSEDFNELPDHITAELEFMSYLVFVQRQAEEAGNSEESIRLKGVQREFLGRFLMPLLEPFTTAVISDGESPFYVAVARCTAAFANADYARLAEHQNG